MKACCVLVLIALTQATSAAAQTVTIRAGLLLDARGGMRRNVVVGNRETLRVKTAGATPATDHRRRQTALAGLIDTHVHITSHFGKDGRASNAGETAQQQFRAAAENATRTLLAGFTTIQSVG